MNILATNDCPVQAAIEHNDIHLRKQLIEAGHFEPLCPQQLRQIADKIDELKGESN